MGPQNDIFSRFAKHNKRFVANPNLTKKLVFHKWSFLKHIGIDVDQKHNLKKKNDKKGFERQSKTGNPKTKRIDGKKRSNIMF